MKLPKIRYKLSILKKKDSLFKQLKSLRKILFEFAALVSYQRNAIDITFEITHPLQANLINFNDL